MTIEEAQDVADLTQERDALRDALANAAREVAACIEMGRELEELRERNAELGLRVLEIRAECREWAQGFTEAVAESNEAREELRRCHATIAELHGQVAEWQGNAYYLREELDTAKGLLQ